MGLITCPHCGATISDKAVQCPKCGINSLSSAQYIQQPQQQPTMPPPDNYMVWSILSTLFCCLIGGAVAIYYSSQVNNLWNFGKHNEAYQASKSAKTWILVSVISGIIGYIISLIAAFAD